AGIGFAHPLVVAARHLVEHARADPRGVGAGTARAQQGMGDGGEAVGGAGAFVALVEDGDVESEVALQRDVRGHVDQGRFEHAVAEVGGVGTRVEQARAFGPGAGPGVGRARGPARGLLLRGHRVPPCSGNAAAARPGTIFGVRAACRATVAKTATPPAKRLAGHWNGPDTRWTRTGDGVGIAPRRSRMSRIQRIFAWGLFTLVLMLLSGWLLADHLTPPAVGKPSHALPVQAAQTELDREIAPLVERHDGKNGIILLPDGLDAFAARALSARKAGRSLDLQYYIWHNDPTGRLLAHEAWQAAERGVRVRVLLDDMNTQGDDTDLLAFDGHPNIEIRVYNPFRNRGGPMRVFELVQRFFSVNHRMHNKAWIADGRFAVLGGRNIGQEYFDASTDTNFRDLDAVLFGPKVAQASAIFDAFWNSEAAVPISSLSKRSKQELDEAVARVRAEAAGKHARVYMERMEASPTVRGYFRGELSPHWSDAIEVASDPPLKWKEDDRGDWLVGKL